MDYTDLKDKVIVLLEKIVEHNDFLKKDEKASLLELDVIMQDMRSLYDVYAQMRKDLETNLSEEQGTTEGLKEEPSRIGVYEKKKEAAPKEITESEEPGEEPGHKPVETQKAETEYSEKQNHEKDLKIKESEVKEPETASEDSAPAEKEHSVVDSGSYKEKQPADEPANSGPAEENRTKRIADKFENGDQALGEKLVSLESSLHDKISGEKEDHSIGAKMQQKSIANIKDAIGVNEKFLFINELFNGNIQAYNEAVDKLNNFGNINEAFEYINELTTAFSWDGQRSATTIEKFASLVQRRYMSN